MNLVPKRWLHDGKIRTVPGPKGTVIIECEVTDPPSARNKTAHLFLIGEDLTDVFKELRNEAREARR